MADKLLARFGDIHDASMSKGRCLRRCEHKLHQSSVPMNDLYWIIYDSIDDKAASMDDFKYIDYEDYKMMRVWAFKKDR